jgi:hypothetical protein
VAILDMNSELAQELVKEIGGEKAKFFESNVLETESISTAVKGALAWSKEIGKEIGGVIAAAGVSTPAKVRLTLLWLSSYYEIPNGILSTYPKRSRSISCVYRSKA